MNITIIGLGLIGGSMALALKENGFASQVFGVESNESHGELALALNLIDRLVTLETGVQLADIIVLATPVNHIVTLAPQILDLVNDQVVMDVGSTKEHIMMAIKDHPKRGRFVGCHPMAGTEYSGPQAAVNKLFDGKCVVVVDHETSDPDAVKLVRNLFTSLKMNIVYHESHDHDIHTAYVSHISHISSFALAITVLEKEENEKRIFELAGGGFRSTARLANSNSKTWTPIFEQNREHVLDVLGEYISTLIKFQTTLVNKDFVAFNKMIEQANQIKKIVQ